MYIGKKKNVVWKEEKSNLEKYRESGIERREEISIKGRKWWK